MRCFQEEWQDGDQSFLNNDSLAFVSLSGTAACRRVPTNDFMQGVKNLGPHQAETPALSRRKVFKVAQSFSDMAAEANSIANIVSNYPELQKEAKKSLSVIQKRLLSAAGRTIVKGAFVHRMPGSASCAQACIEKGCMSG
jgi:hypothetical protein